MLYRGDMKDDTGAARRSLLIDDGNSVRDSLRGTLHKKDTSLWKQA